jgi:hypothetical protein
MATPNRPPLWEVLQNARFDVYRKAIGNPTEQEYGAAQIRALRDWLVPEPEEPGFTATDEAFAIWEERKALRAVLAAEADRAERGDD